MGEGLEWRNQDNSNGDTIMNSRIYHPLLEETGKTDASKSLASDSYDRKFNNDIVKEIKDYYYEILEPSPPSGMRY